MMAQLRQLAATARGAKPPTPSRAASMARRTSSSGALSRSMAAPSRFRFPTATCSGVSRAAVRVGSNKSPPASTNIFASEFQGLGAGRVGK